MLSTPSCQLSVHSDLAIKNALDALVKRFECTEAIALLYESVVIVFVVTNIAKNVIRRNIVLSLNVICRW